MHRVLTVPAYGGAPAVPQSPAGRLSPAAAGASPPFIEPTSEGYAIRGAAGRATSGQHAGHPSRPRGHLPGRPPRSGMAAVIGHLRQHRVQVEGSRLLAWRELGEVLDLRGHRRLHEVKLGNVIDHPIKVSVGVEIRALERIAA